MTQRLPEIQPPATRDEIIRAFDSVYRQSEAYWSQFETADFFKPLGEAWSPAENVRHLIKSTRPVVQALALPKWLLRLRFGAPQHKPDTYESLRKRYAEALAAGGQAGRFAPSRRAEGDLPQWRERITGQRALVGAKLVKNLSRWSEESLDRIQLPHPLLGKLTVREMMFFTLYHHIHHVAVVERRRTESR